MTDQDHPTLRQLRESITQVVAMAERIATGPEYRAVEQVAAEVAALYLRSALPGIDAILARSEHANAE